MKPVNIGNVERLYALAPPGGKLAEVGVWRGDNAANMLMAARPSLLVLVDQWRNVNDPTNAALGDPAGFETNYFYTVERFVKDREVVVMRMPSVAAAGLFAPRTFDLVYIDASHLEENVLADLEAWYPKVKPGGLLCGHDWGTWEGVEQAIHKFLTIHPQCVHEYVAKAPGRDPSYGLRVAS